MQTYLFTFTKGVNYSLLYIYIYIYSLLVMIQIMFQCCIDYCNTAVRHCLHTKYNFFHFNVSAYDCSWRVLRFTQVKI